MSETTPLMAEFRGVRLFSLWLNEQGYWHVFDVEYCERDDAYYIESAGTGGDPCTEDETTYWTTPDVFVKTQNSQLLAELPEPWTEQALLALVAEGEMVCCWCAACVDTLPTDNPCEHMFFCNECLSWMAAGDYCAHYYEECQDRAEEAQGMSKAEHETLYPDVPFDEAH